MGEQSDADIMLQTAQGNMTSLESAIHAITNDDGFATDGNCISYEDWSWDVVKKRFSFQPVLQPVDLALNEAMFNIMTSF